MKNYNPFFKTFLLVTLLIQMVVFPMSSLAYVDFNAAKVETNRVPSSNQPDDWSDEPAINGDGRFIAFQSDATNLIVGDSNNASDIFVCDRVSGVTERVSYDIDGTQFEYGSSWPDISADGRYVAFINYGKVYVYDRTLNKSEIVGSSFLSPSISDDGRYVTYYRDNYVYLYDRSDDSLLQIDAGENPKISGDGNYIAYNHEGGVTCCDWQIWVYDVQKDTKVRVDVNSNGDASAGSSYFPSISANGRYIVFESFDTTLIDPIYYDQSRYTTNIFVHDRDADHDGIFDEQSEPGAIKTEMINLSSDGVPANDSSGNPNGWGEMISDNGRYVAFQSAADNLVLGDNNGIVDIFVRDLLEQKTIRVSVSSTGEEATQAHVSTTWWAAISGDGQIVVFASGATNLVDNDTNDTDDIFVAHIIENLDGVLNVTADQSMSESNLDSINLNISLDNNTFINSNPNQSNFILNNAPTGLTIENITYIDNTHATIALAFDGSDFDEDITNFSVTIRGAELAKGNDLKSNNMSIEGLLEKGNLQLSSTEYFVNEGDGSASITVIREGGYDGYLSGAYRLFGETATEDNDFIGLSSYYKYIGFDIGEISKTFTIDIVDDEIIEDNETLYIELSGGEMGDENIGSPNSAVLTIIDNDGALEFPKVDLSNGIIGHEYNHTFLASGGTAPYSFELESGNLPPGLQLDTLGALTGNPSESGAFTFIIAVTDSADTMITQEFTLIIDEEPLVLVGGTLDNGMINQEYTHHFSGNGGTPPYSFSLKDGYLPQGLLLNENGTLSGTPSETGTFSFTIEVTDRKSNVNQGQFTLIINDEVDSIPPSFEKGYLDITDITYQSILLKWSPATDNVGVTEYGIYKDGNLIATVPASILEYRVTGLSSRVTSTFKVEAKDAAGNWSNNGPTKTGTTRGYPDNVPPKWKLNPYVNVTNITPTSVTLNWSEATDNRGHVMYNFYVNDRLWGGLDWIYRTFEINNLEPNHEYNITVKAIDPSGNDSSGNPSITVTTLPLEIELNLRTDKEVGYGEISINYTYNKDLKFEISTDNSSIITNLQRFVVIPKNQTSARFSFKVKKVYNPTEVTITATSKNDKVSGKLKFCPNEYAIKDLGVYEDEGSIIKFIDSDTGLVGVQFNGQDEENGVVPRELNNGNLTLPINAFPLSMNHSNIIVGQYKEKNQNSQSIIRAFRYGGNGLQLIDTIGGVDNSAYDINDEGYIVGWSEVEEQSNIRHAFLATPGLGVLNPTGLWVEVNRPEITDLGTLGGNSSEAYAINNNNIIVGKSEIEDGNTEEHGFIYSRERGMCDLNNLIDYSLDWELLTAYDISDFGQIVGVGLLDGKKHVFLLTPRNK